MENLQIVVDSMKSQVEVFTEMMENLRNEGKETSPAYYCLAGKRSATLNCIRRLEAVLRLV